MKIAQLKVAQPGRSLFRTAQLWTALVLAGILALHWASPGAVRHGADNSLASPQPRAGDALAATSASSQAGGRGLSVAGAAGVGGAVPTDAAPVLPAQPGSEEYAAEADIEPAVLVDYNDDGADDDAGSTAAAAGQPVADRQGLQPSTGSGQEAAAAAGAAAAVAAAISAGAHQQMQQMAGHGLASAVGAQIGGSSSSGGSGGSSGTSGSAELQQGPGSAAAGGEGLEPFTVFILDPNAVLWQIPSLSGPQFQCNISSPSVWPHDQPGRGMDASDTTPHWAYQHAVQYWVTQALRNSSLVRVVDREEDADLVYVDMYCFAMWSYSHGNPLGEHNQPPPRDYIVAAMQHIEGSVGFRRHGGANYVLLESHPGLVGTTTPPFDQAKMCGPLSQAFWFVPEHSSLCRGQQEALHQNRAALLPYVAVSDLQLQPLPRLRKPIFLFYRGACAPGPPFPDLAPQYSSGKLLRAAVVEGLRRLPPSALALPGNRTADVRVGCSCDICRGEPEHLSHQQSLAQLADSLFCPVLPGDTQSSRRLSEVVLSGCIPVFLGPPFHTLPLADEVDYKAFSVFIRLENTSSWLFDRAADEAVLNDRERVLERWQPDDPGLTAAAHSVRSVEAAFRLLAATPDAEVERMQTALERERLKLLYSPPPAGGAQTSVLGELLVRKLSRRATALRALHAQPAPDSVGVVARRALRWAWGGAGRRCLRRAGRRLGGDSSSSIGGHA